MRKIKVLVVEDSVFFRELLVKHLNNDPALEVVASAKDPFEARDMIVKHKPDVMTLDIEMPRMNGIEFLRKLMPQYPMPVVMISSLSDKVFEALNAGAVDFVAKPAMTDRKKLEELMTNELPIKIKIASTAKIGNIKRAVVPELTETVSTNASSKDLVLAIGASTGGTEAIATILKEFGTDIPGTVVVQHMPAGFTEMYANRLNDQCRVTVKEAKNGDKVLPGQVLIAPGGDCQMRLIKVNGTYQVEVKPGPKVSGHCPSVDVLFESVAKAAGSRALGIILTGMGGDGAKGLLEMRKAGAKTIGQDESTCVVYGMPKVAFDIGAVEHQEKLSDIAKKTYAVLNNM
ncbi:MAG: chemotaxis response regulator protein-glutamate methylesterase [Agathobacter sp.]|nr:chemotaxis response regulator protein-glutamate methylesterase [Agathobacter sp.]MBQ2902663.1 chemotaxis response regulator protein-glutamate methylesterase [Agathobacter sp.]